ncbi:MAG: sigma 54-interacting transcriptional regulator [Thermoanaerobaculales bacterium]|jgi:transcriptional regulator with PAS, ATPase and Fis domain|nr:sigma 54-interacting transcriptional regulator [Thermoanaerobaculales bacterium]
MDNVATIFGNPRELFDALFDALPCGVIVVDQDRKIRAANQAFERAVGLEPGAAVGSCEGSAMGCLNAAKPHDHNAAGIEKGCRTCEARQLALSALDLNVRQRGRAHFQITVDGRVEDITLTMAATPFDSDGRRFAIVVIEDIHRLRGLRRPAVGGSIHGMVGNDPKMLALYETVAQVGPLDVPVLILGESGVGKELVANALHAESRRSGRLLVPVNCGALPDGLLESELFGHVRGAFTGAVRDKKGRFQLADGGTILLDEIGELSSQMQVKFLRVLQNGTFERVGDEHTIEVDARVICATNRDLESEVEAGRFRADLYYRLSVVPIVVPPLRERIGDVPDLVEFFLGKIADDTGRDPPLITEEAMSRLKAHRWPGNVRELENAVRFSVIKAQGSPIREEHLPPQVRGARVAQATPSRQQRLDWAVVEGALNATDGNKSEAAKKLGVSRATLYRFLSANPTSS